MKTIAKGTPTIKTIKYYQHLPEKMYRIKLLTITLLDLFIFFLLSYAYLLKMYNEVSASDISQELVNFVIRVGFYIVGFIIIPIVVLLIIGKFIPFVYNSTRKFFKNLKIKVWEFRGLYRKRENSNNALMMYHKEQLIKEKKRKKAQPFLHFRKSRVGRLIRVFLVFSHINLYIYLLVNLDTTSFVDVRYNESIYKVYLALIILYPIIFLVLSKQPERAIEKSKNNLKEIFIQYLSPSRKGNLSQVEREEFEKNFDARISNGEYIQRGYYEHGVYFKTEYYNVASVYIEDLNDSLTYSFRYFTDEDYYYWDPRDDSLHYKLVPK